MGKKSNARKAETKADRVAPRARPNGGSGTSPTAIGVSWQLQVDADIDKDSWEWETGDAEKKGKDLIDNGKVPQNLEEW